MPSKKKNHWHQKVCNHNQIAGIETSVIDNGPGRGNRIAWINTGSGLRYKVVIDRALDIVDAFYNQHSLAWISHGGITAPRPDSDHGIEWLYSFAGGFLTTCGLTHVGGPESDDTGDRGLHGRISNLPAEVESIIQPDLNAGRLDMSITAVTTESRVFGPSLELRRTISSRVGDSTIKVTDVVTNCASTPVPHMILYHCNFGYPLIDEGADILFNGTCKSRGMDMDNAIFDSGHNFRKCSKPLASHRGFGEACGFIDPKADRSGTVTVGIRNRKLNLALALKYNKTQLPALANWQHWGIGDYVCALEPGTNYPIGRIAAKKQKKLITLKPGQSRTTELEFMILTDKKDIEAFVKKASPK